MSTLDMSMGTKAILHRLCQAAGGAACLIVIASEAADYSQWRGPNRDGISRETGVTKEWPAGGPKLLWSIDTAGAGYSTPFCGIGDPFPPEQ